MSNGAVVMICPTCDGKEIQIIDTMNRDDGGVDELVGCEACGYKWTAINPGDRRMAAAAVKLKKWMARAHNIQFTTCDCGRKRLLLSYQTGHKREKDRHFLKGVEYEGCGYWCYSCEWGNAGGREVEDR